MEEQLVCNHQCIFAKHKNLFHVSGVVKQTFELLRGPTQGLMSRFSQRSGPASGQSCMKRRQFIPRNPEALKVQDGRLVDFNGSALSAGRAGVVDVSLVVGRAQ